MDVKLDSMTYEEFKNWCNDRARDGRWSMLEAMACIDVMKEIDSIKVKGLFKKKATMRAREEEWKRRNYKSLS